MKISFKCSRAETHPINRKIGEAKEFECIELSSDLGYITLTLDDPKTWNKFYEDREYEIEFNI